MSSAYIPPQRRNKEPGINPPRVRSAYIPPQLRNKEPEINPPIDTRGSQRRTSKSTLSPLSEASELTVSNVKIQSGSYDNSNKYQTSSFPIKSRGKFNDDDDETNSVNSIGTRATSTYSVDMTHHGLRRVEQKFEGNIRIIQKVLKNIHKKVKDVQIITDDKTNTIKVKTNGVVAIFCNMNKQCSRPRLITAYPSSSSSSSPSRPLHSGVSVFSSFDDGLPWELAIGKSFNESFLKHLLICREKINETLLNGDLLDSKELRCSSFSLKPYSINSLYLNTKTSFIGSPPCIFSEEKNIIWSKELIKKSLNMALSILSNIGSICNNDKADDDEIDDNNGMMIQYNDVKLHSGVTPCIYAKLGSWANDKKKLPTNFSLILHFLPYIQGPFDAVSYTSYPYLRFFNHFDPKIDNINNIKDGGGGGGGGEGDNLSETNPLPTVFYPFVFATNQEDDTASRQQWFIHHNGGMEGIIISKYDTFLIQAFNIKNNEHDHDCLATLDINRSGGQVYPVDGQKWSLYPDNNNQNYFTIHSSSSSLPMNKQKVISCDENGYVSLISYDKDDIGQKFEIISCDEVNVQSSSPQTNPAAAADDGNGNDDDDNEYGEDDNACAYKFRNLRGQYLTCGAAHAKDSLPTCHPKHVQFCESMRKTSVDSIESNIKKSKGNVNVNLNNNNDNLSKDINKRLSSAGFYLVFHKDQPSSIGFAIKNKKENEKLNPSKINNNNTNNNNNNKNKMDNNHDTIIFYNIENILTCFMLMFDISELLSESVNRPSIKDLMESKSKYLQSDLIGQSLLRLFLTNQRGDDTQNGIFLDENVMGVLTLSPEFFDAFYSVYTPP